MARGVPRLRAHRRACVRRLRPHHSLAVHAGLPPRYHRRLGQDACQCQAGCHGKPPGVPRLALSLAAGMGQVCVPPSTSIFRHIRIACWAWRTEPCWQYTRHCAYMRWEPLRRIVRVVEGLRDGGPAPNWAQDGILSFPGLSNAELSCENISNCKDVSCSLVLPLSRTGTPQQRTHNRNCHADFRVMMIKVLALIPFFGQGMQLFEFIFLNQKADKDLKIIAKNLDTARRDVGLPLWMLIFPEGTLNTPGNVARSQKYAEKMGIAPHPQHCILPKSLGLFHTIQSLTPQMQDVFDVTIGYSGVQPGEVPYDILLPDEVFFKNGYPREVHMHVSRFHVEDLPGFSQAERETGIEEERKSAFEVWLRGVWKAKDERLHEFYLNGDMNVSGLERKLVVNLVPRGEDILYYVGLLVAMYLLVPIYWNIVYWSVVFVMRLVYVSGWLLLSTFGLSRLTIWAAFFTLLGQHVGMPIEADETVSPSS
ncbi:hypothetical protein BC830DRAFT_193626 [Chytriomyces sp. MP71]|nr:hypothetical protein BC830DRAFT_193626 [Chytriomyces sp. MP71]